MSAADGSSTSVRWTRIRRLLASCEDKASVLEALSSSGSGAGSLGDLLKDTPCELWDEQVRHVSLWDLAVAVMLSEGIYVERERGTWKRRRAPRMTQAEMRAAMLRIKSVITKHPGLQCAEIASAAKVDRGRCGKLIVKLRQAGEIRSEGERATMVHFPV